MESSAEPEDVPENGIKVEKLEDQTQEPSVSSKDQMGYFVYVKVEPETEEDQNMEIKHEPKFEMVEIKIEPDSPEHKYNTKPPCFDVTVKIEKDSPESGANCNTQDHAATEETVINEPNRPNTASSSQDVKQEPKDVDQTDPDDVTTQSIPEGSEQHEMEDIKRNIQDYLDIGETVLCEQDKASNEQDRKTPGTSSNENKSGAEGRKSISTEKPYRCEICDCRFTFLRGLKEHLRIHTGEKLFRCEACDFQCKRNSNLKRHMKTHIGEKPYVCEACDHRFVSNSGLKKHILRTHTGEKQYKCDVCDYRCTLGNSLKIHMRRHNGEKPYKCEACDYRCAVRSSLKMHMRRHNGEKPYKCKVCDYRCTQGSSLTKHMRTHTGEKPFKCEACDYRCPDGGNLKRHMRTHIRGKRYRRALATAGAHCPVD